MQKQYRLLGLLSVLAIVSIFMTGVALGAEVTKIHVRKGSITIDEGKPAGFVMGAEVCFYSFSGEKITCGRIRQTSDNFATVHVDNREAHKIERGMKAVLSDSKTTEKTD